MPAVTRPSDAHCRGVRRICPVCLSGIREQAPDAFSQPGHAWLITTHKKRMSILMDVHPFCRFSSASGGWKPYGPDAEGVRPAQPDLPTLSLSGGKGITFCSLSSQTLTLSSTMKDTLFSRLGHSKDVSG